MSELTLNYRLWHRTRRCASDCGVGGLQFDTLSYFFTKVITQMWRRMCANLILGTVIDTDTDTDTDTYLIPIIIAVEVSRN